MCDEALLIIIGGVGSICNDVTVCGVVLQYYGCNDEYGCDDLQ